MPPILPTIGKAGGRGLNRGSGACLASQAIVCHGTLFLDFTNNVKITTTLEMGRRYAWEERKYSRLHGAIAKLQGAFRPQTCSCTSIFHHA